MTRIYQNKSFINNNFQKLMDFKTLDSLEDFKIKTQKHLNG